MKMTLAIFLVLISTSLLLMWIRWKSLPEEVRQSIILGGYKNQTYFQLPYELHELDTIEKIVIYRGFFHLDDKTIDKTRIKIFVNKLERAEDEKIIYSDLRGNILCYDNEGKLVGIGIKSNESWKIETKRGFFRFSSDIDEIID